MGSGSSFGSWADTGSGSGSTGPSSSGSVSASASAPRFSAKRLSRRVAAEVTASAGNSVTRPSAEAVPSKVRVVPPSVSVRPSVSVSLTEPVPRVSVASPSTAYDPSAWPEMRTEPR